MNEKRLERASLYLHGRDIELKTLLEARARANNRSLSAEMVVTLWRGVRIDGDEPYVYTVEVNKP